MNIWLVDFLLQGVLMIPLLMSLHHMKRDDIGRQVAKNDLMDFSLAP